MPRLSTLAIHAGAGPDPATGARTVPIYHSNGYIFDDLEHGSDLFALDRAGYAYGRSGNPTVAAFERRIAALEGGCEAATRVTGRLRLFSHLVNVGEVKSLVAHPATTTHRNMDPQTRAALGITDGTLRLSAGLEDIEDLTADFGQALA